MEACLGEMYFKGAKDFFSLFFWNHLGKCREQVNVDNDFWQKNEKFAVFLAIFIRFKLPTFNNCTLVCVITSGWVHYMNNWSKWRLTFLLIQLFGNGNKSR